MALVNGNPIIEHKLRGKNRDPFGLKEISAPLLFETVTEKWVLFSVWRIKVGFQRRQRHCHRRLCPEFRPAV